MSKLISILHSSVGKKFLVGATGLFLCTFLVVHLGGNLLLFKSDGGEAYNAFATFMSHNPIIGLLEYVLFGGLIAHIITATILWIKNKAARKVSYKVTKPLETSSFSSRITFVSGSIVLFFLVVHLKNFWLPSRFFGEENMYLLTKEVFANGFYDGLYIAALFLLGFHLKHGFQSAFQTFGIRGKRYEGLINAIAVIFWLAIPAAFAAMPLYFLLHLNS